MEERIFVCHGHGVTPEYAINRAAQSANEFLAQHRGAFVSATQHTIVTPRFEADGDDEYHSTVTIVYRPLLSGR